MTTKRLSNEFMEKILNDAVWKELSEGFKWTEQTLEKYKDKVDWKAVSGNSEILWTPAMLEKFKNQLDWTKLSSTSSQTLLNVSNLERFKDYWNWSELSENSDLELSYGLIDKFMDLWDWSELINRYRNEDFYSFEFLERYLDKIPANKFQDSRLWDKLVEIRKYEMAYELVS